METCSKLELWQRRLSQSNTYYQTEVEKMDRREAQYRGDREISPLVDGDKSPSGAKHQATHVRNIIFENIESQVSVAIPQPKVTPRRKKDEGLASLIEHLIRNELDRLPMERINDMSERTVPIQGGVGYLTDWDNSKRTHTTVGEVDIAMVHPKQFAPQPGVYTSVADMDWFIVKLPTTKAAVRRRYGKSVYQESESEPEIRGAGDADHNEDAVTQYVGFAINDQGGIDRYSWVNNVELEDLENYQARRQQVCAKCGMQRPAAGQILAGHIAQEIRPPEPDPNGQLAAEMLAMRLAEEQMGMEPTGISAAVPGEPEQRYDGGACPWCGCEKFESRTQKFEQIFVPMQTAGGLQIPGAAPGLDAQGMPAMIPAQIPYYVPDVYPIVIQRSVSVYGQLLGNSDVDVIADQQNTANRLSKKIIDRLLKAGTRITLPPKANLQTDPSDGEIWYLENVADKQYIDVYQFSGELQYELAYLAQVYEEARQILGITDSFQGRRDPTATSGVAKQASAAQAAGRLESKRIMKNAAYAELFELIFKYWLAYSDEPRAVSYKDEKGNTVYEEFNRYDFLERDANGEYYWNDQFLFSCDTSAPLAGNREALWQETRMNLQTGAFGNPQSTETLILFWTKMEELHYPGAGTTKAFLEERLKREQEQARMMQQMQLQQGMGAQVPGQGGQLPMG